MPSLLVLMDLEVLSGLVAIVSKPPHVVEPRARRPPKWGRSRATSPVNGAAPPSRTPATATAPGEVARAAGLATAGDVRSPRGAATGRGVRSRLRRFLETGQVGDPS